MKLVFIAISIILFVTFFDSTSAETRLVCFWNPMSSNRNGRGISTVKKIDEALPFCTHLVYGYFNVDNDGTIFQPQIGNVDELFIYQFASLRRINRNIKIFASIGGPDFGEKTFIEIASDADKRLDFGNKILQFLIDYHFDGVDLYWPFPGGDSKNNFVELLGDIQAILKKYNKSLTISATTDDRSVLESYNIAEIVNIVDFVNLDIARLHDTSGISEVAVPHSPPRPLSSSDELNFESILSSWMQLDISLEKIVPGIPTYGRSYTLKNSMMFGLGTAVTGNGNRGEYGAENIRGTSILPFNEICYNLKNNANWKGYLHQESSSPYAVYNNDQWVGFDDVDSVGVKVFFAMVENTFGGIAFYDIDMDDFANDCGFGYYPLLQAAYGLIFDGEDPPTPPEETTIEVTETTVTATEPQTTPNPEFSCRGRPDGNYQNPANCRTFFMCSNGYKFLMDCPGGLFFDPDRNQCLHRPPSGCVVP